MIIDAAAMRLSSVKNWPPRLAIDDVIGRWSPWLSSTTAQKKSLYSQVNSSVASAASAGRHSGRMIWKYCRNTLAPSTIAASPSSFGIVFM